MKILTILLAILLTSCAGQTIVSTGVGVHTATDGHQAKIDGKASALFEIKHVHPSGFFGKCVHESNPTKGRPFSEGFEYWSESCYVGFQKVIRDAN